MPNTVRVAAQVTGASKAASDLDKFKDKFTNLQKQSAKGLGIGVGVAAAGKAFSLLDTAVSGAISWLGQAGEEYQKEETSIAKMNTALLNNVKGWNGNTDAVEKQISANQKLGFFDDELRSSLAGIVAITHDVNSAFADQQIAMDLARAKSIDLATASDLIAKVAGGNIGILSRYGIVVKKGSTATEALAQIQKMVAGQAAAYLGTETGKLAAAQVKANDAQEKFGKIVTEVEAVALPALADGLTSLADGLESVEKKAEPPIKALGDLVDKLNALKAAIPAPVQQAVDLADKNVRLGESLAGSNGVIPQISAVIDLFGQWTDASQKTTDSGVKPLTDATEKLPGAVLSVVSAEKSATASGGKWQQSLEPLKKTLDGLKTSTNDVNTAISGLFDTENSIVSIKGQLAQAAEDLAALIKAGPDSKSQNDLDIYAQKVADAQAAVLALQGQLAQAEGPAAFKAWLDQEGKSLDLTNPKLREQYNLLLLTAAAAGKLPPITGQIGIRTTGTAAHKAAGGPVSAGVPYTVGEVGPELFVPKQSGTIVPNNQLRTSVGGNTYIVNVQGLVKADTPAAILSTMQRLQAIAP